MSLRSLYQVFRKDRPTPGGGVAILVKQNLRCSEVSLPPHAAEIIAVDLFIDNFSVRITSAYISPTGNAEALLERTHLTCSVMETLCQAEHPIVLLGDFNLPRLSWSASRPPNEGTREFVFSQFCDLNGLAQMVEDATRPASNNLLDLLLTNNPLLIDNLCTIPPPFKSDHEAVSFSLLVPSADAESPRLRDFHRADYDSIASSLQCTNWHTFFSGCDSVQHMFARLSTLLLDLIAEFVPLSRPRTGPRSKLEKLVLSLTAQAVHSPHCDALRKKLAKASRRLRVLEENRLNFNDCSSFFKYVNARLRCRPSVGPLRVDDSRGVLTAPGDMATEFLKFFASVYHVSSSSNSVTRSSSDWSPPLDFSYDAVHSKLNLLPLKVTTTPDVFPPIFFRHLADELAEPLRLLFTRSLADCEVPEAFRLAVTTPIHKKGDRKNVTNYRPVAQLSISCIIMEKLVVDYLTRFLVDSNQADINQHGFFKGRSTETQLLEVVQDFGMALSRNEVIHAVYFDFSKAFDKVDHNLLLDKLARLGVRMSVINWIGAYLRDRRFVVKVGSTFSSPASSPSGVPQGSALGPALWNAFILDIKDFIPPGITYKLYADDLKVYSTVSDSSPHTNLQRAIDGVSEWARLNRMELAAAKCAVIKTNPCDISYSMNGTTIPIVSTVRDLGVLFSNDLLFREQVSSVVRSSSTLCNLILRSFIVKRPKYYTRLFRSLVEPRFLYCSPVWTPGLKGDIQRLERVRRRFIRLVAIRCQVPRESISSLLPEIAVLHHAADKRAMSRIVASPHASKFFVIRRTGLRSGTSIQPLSLARSNVVHNLFSWRCCKQRTNPLCK